jgi:glucuronosyltransferase
LFQDLKHFLDEAKEGAIFFSMGTNIKSSKMPPEKVKAFLDAFAELPQRVLWKWEAESLPGQPKNVMLGKWFPQNDILGTL